MSNQYDVDQSPPDIISCVKFSPDGEALAVSCWDTYIYIYKRSSEAPHNFALHKRINCEAPALDVAWGNVGDEHGLFFVGLYSDGRVGFINTETEEQTLLSWHGRGGSNKLAYSREHDIVLSTSWNGTMNVYSNGPYIRIKLADKPFALAVTSDRAVVAMADRKISVYNLKDLKQLVQQAGGTATDQEILEVEPWQRRESSLKFMARDIACTLDGEGYAISSIEGRVGVEWFDPEMQKKSYAFKCHRQPNKTQDENGEEKIVDIIYPVNAVAFHPIHGTFATGGGDGVVALWDSQSKRRVKQYKELGESIAALDFSPDGKLLAIGVCPGFEDGEELVDVDPNSVKVVIRELTENEAKPKASKQ